ncbi:MAG: hydrogenase formation protein HypD [Phycisphaerae bacterium]|jgi:hydrogenase expression/formation protein HypD
MLRRIYNAQKMMDAAVEKLGKINIMEVCGTHTVTIFRNGVRTAIPKQLNLISGPGCPVCVTDQSYIDICLDLVKRDDCILATYGDMIRVPGQSGSLETHRGKNVKVVFSAMDALLLAKEHPDKTIVLLAVGFETTAPSSAIVVKEAQQQGLKNFCIYSGHKIIIPAMRALLSEKNNNIDAFLCPGHVSVITGYGVFREIADDFGKACVVAGFEPMQIFEGLAEICRLLREEKKEVTNIYSAVVTENGNPKAKELLDEVFIKADGYWRGLGKIEKSTLKLKDEFAQFDALKRFGIEEKPHEDRSGCRCGEVLCGLIEPPQCGLFESRCTPESPVGPCMVSSEGTCAAWYKYGRRKREQSR